MHLYISLGFFFFPDLNVAANSGQKLFLDEVARLCAGVLKRNSTLTLSGMLKQMQIEYPHWFTDISFGGGTMFVKRLKMVHERLGAESKMFIERCRKQMGKGPFSNNLLINPLVLLAPKTSETSSESVWRSHSEASQVTLFQRIFLRYQTLPDIAKKSATSDLEIVRGASIAWSNLLPELREVSDWKSREYVYIFSLFSYAWQNNNNDLENISVMRMFCRVWATGSKNSRKGFSEENSIQNCTLPTPKKRQEFVLSTFFVFVRMMSSSSSTKRRLTRSMWVSTVL